MTNTLDYSAYVLRHTLERLGAVLETFFSGYLLFESPGLNNLYVLLKKRAEEVAEPWPDALAALNDLLNLIPNLYEGIGDPDSPDEHWEFGGQQALLRLKGQASEIYVEHVKGMVSLHNQDAALFKATDEALRTFKAWKSEKERQWVAQVEEKAKEVRRQWEAQAPVTSGYSSAETVAAPAQRALRDEAHAACVEALIRKLRKEGHRAAPEGTYNVYGERGSVDVYYVGKPDDDDSPTGVAIYEVWTEVDNLNEALRKLDEKARVFPQAKLTNKLTYRLVKAHLVLLATKQNMDVVAAHRYTFEAKFSASGTPSTRFFLQVFDPLTGELENLLGPRTVKIEQGLLSRYSRYSTKADFLTKWKRGLSTGQGR